jgi:hypothetical protein
MTPTGSVRSSSPPIPRQRGTSRCACRTTRKPSILLRATTVTRAPSREWSFSSILEAIYDQCGGRMMPHSAAKPTSWNGVLKAFENPRVWQDPQGLMSMCIEADRSKETMGWKQGAGADPARAPGWRRRTKAGRPRKSVSDREPAVPTTPWGRPDRRHRRGMPPACSPFAAIRPGGRRLASARRRPHGRPGAPGSKAD